MPGSIVWDGAPVAFGWSSFSGKIVEAETSGALGSAEPTRWEMIYRQASIEVAESSVSDDSVDSLDAKRAVSAKKHSSTENWLTRLDALDQRLSRPLLTTRLPLVLEYIWSIPGNFFGVPIFACTVTPSVVAWCFAPGPPTESILLLLAIFASVVWMWVLTLRKNRFVTKHIFYGRGFGCLTPLLGMALLFQVPDVRAQQLGFFQLAAWQLAILPIGVLKSVCARARPALVCSSPKHLRRLPFLFRKDAFGSFPSGDAGGAVAVAYPILRCADGAFSKAVALSCILLSATGRIYWQAHHLFDVLVGAGISLLSCALLEQLLLISLDNSDVSSDTGCPCLAKWWHPLQVQVLLVSTIAFFRFVSKRKICGLPEKKLRRASSRSASEQNFQVVDIAFTKETTD